MIESGSRSTSSHCASDATLTPGRVIRLRSIRSTQQTPRAYDQKQTPSAVKMIKRADRRPQCRPGNTGLDCGNTGLPEP
jgi:hypothetical protein